MRRAAAAFAISLPIFGGPHARPPPSRAPSHAPEHVAPPLPMLPSVARVRVEAARDRVVVVEEVSLPRGEWQSGGLDLYVAFGAPGTPIAVDARLVALAPGALESRPDDPGDAVLVEPAVRHTPSSRLLLGRPTMAGVVLHVRDSELRHAYALSDAAALRIRSLLSPPAADAQGAHDLVVRLGIIGGLPLTLGRIQIVSSEPQPWITRAEATLCGPEAERRPLSLTLLPKPAAPVAPGTVPAIAPPMAVRHASDDLCVRWWAPT